jgi:molecular chaperone DnaK (HSP70)
LKDAGLSVSDIDEVILVGGSLVCKIADEVENSLVKKASKGLTLMRLLQLEQLFKVEFFLEM